MRNWEEVRLGISRGLLIYKSWAPGSLPASVQKLRPRRRSQQDLLCAFKNKKLLLNGIFLCSNSLTASFLVLLPVSKTEQHLVACWGRGTGPSDLFLYSEAALPFKNLVTPGLEVSFLWFLVMVVVAAMITTAFPSFNTIMRNCD